MTKISGFDNLPCISIVYVSKETTEINTLYIKLTTATAGFDVVSSNPA